MNYIVHLHGRNYSQKSVSSLSAAVALAKRWVNRSTHRTAQITNHFFSTVETFGASPGACNAVPAFD